VRAAAIPWASGGGILRRATAGDAPLGTSDGDAPEVGVQAAMALPKRTSGGGILRRATGGDAPLGPSDGDAPEVGVQAAMALPKRTSGGGATQAWWRRRLHEAQ
jgi:hypothetical protein